MAIFAKHSILHVWQSSEYASGETWQISTGVRSVCFYYLFISDRYYGTGSLAWKVFIFGVFLVRVFPHSFGLNTERNVISFRIQSKCGKIRNKKIPNTDTFYPVVVWNHSLSTFAKCSEKFTFLTPWYAKFWKILRMY